jgi:hypothetical protein
MDKGREETRRDKKRREEMRRQANKRRINQKAMKKNQPEARLVPKMLKNYLLLKVSFAISGACGRKN